MARPDHNGSHNGLTGIVTADSKRGSLRRVPVVREVLADLDTPLSVYLKVAAGRYSYLLESVQGGEQWGRYSIIGLSCQEIIRAGNGRLTLTRAGEVVEDIAVDDPMQWIEDYAAQFETPDLPNLPRMTGGFVGYFGYDCVRYSESRLRDTTPPDELDVPDILLMRSEELIVFDNVEARMVIIVHADADDEADKQRAEKRLTVLAGELSNPLLANPTDMPSAKTTETEPAFRSGFEQPDYEAAVERIRDYIRAGDVMQVVLSQRLSLPFEGNGLAVYRALRRLNPSPYLYYLNLDDIEVVGSSPEILVRVEDDEVTLRPIAGTRPRGETPAEDQALEEELLADPKECAEHLMLIDLGRNDVGRVAETGSVILTEKMGIERYSHVMHIVSNVVGRLRQGLSAMQALRASLPAGTLSGAPKVRAMEIIDELEPVKRGIYGGAVGYLAYNGSMDTAIAIRTAVIKDGQLHIQAGAGIVADSVPAKEWEETMNKAKAVCRAVALVNQNDGQV